MKWYKSEYPNIRYYRHDSRKHGVNYDKYFTGSYQVAGIRYPIGFGWASEGWSAKLCHDYLMYFKHNCKTGQGPKTLKELKKIEKQKEKEKLEEQRKKEKEEITLNYYFQCIYCPQQTQKKQKTLHNEKNIYKNWIAPHIGDLKIKDINENHVKKLYTTIYSIKSERTAQHICVIGKHIINNAIQDNVYYGSNPFNVLKLGKKIDNKRRRFLSKHEATQVMDALCMTNIQLHDMALLSLHCGLRWGEITKLQWIHVDFNSKIIDIQDTKSHRSRNVYMTNKVYNMLQYRYNQTVKNGYVFLNQYGAPHNYVPKKYYKIIDDIGLNDNITDDRYKCVFHTLRHTYASWQVQAGMSLYHLQELLGHSTIEMVQRYAHLAPDAHKTATVIFDNDK